LEKKIVSGMMMTLLLSSMLTLAFNIQPIKAEPKTWTVDDDGPADFSTIQEAINAAGSGDTIYVKAGMYNEDITINKPLTLVGENSTLTIIYGSGNREVVIIDANNVNFSGFTVKGRGGLWGGWTGIWILDGVSGVNISNNDILFHGSAVELEEYTSGIVIQGNNISNSLFGIDLYFSTSNIIKSNTITSNGYGIHISYSDDNMIIDNLITNHLGWPRYGIELNISNDTIIYGNTISNNYRGISVKGSSNNKIYHNNFIDNAEQVIIWTTYRDDMEIESHNIWDDGYPSGGNYWSDYCGVDEYSGPYQNETGSDGIGDTPYVIDENNQDNYPLMQPWPPKQVSTKVSVKPSDQTVLPTSPFTINITVENVVDLFGWQIVLYYNSSILREESITLPPDHVFEDKQCVELGPFIESDSKGTYIAYGATLLAPPGVTVTGSRVLCQINFTGQAPGTSWLNLGKTTDGGMYTKLRNSNAENIPISIIDGKVTVTEVETEIETLIYDLNNDGKVDIDDLVEAALAFGSYPGHPRWNSIADVNQDDQVDIDDLILIAMNFGKTYNKD
jgi:parallel beta-helix repeat protein